RTRQATAALPRNHRTALFPCWPVCSAEALACAAGVALLFRLSDIVRFVRFPLHRQVQRLRLDDFLVRSGCHRALAAAVSALLPRVRFGTVLGEASPANAFADLRPWGVAVACVAGISNRGFGLYSVAPRLAQLSGEHQRFPFRAVLCHERRSARADVPHC